MSKHEVQTRTRQGALPGYSTKSEGLLSSQMQRICLERGPTHFCQPTKIKVGMESWLGSGAQKG